MLHIVPNYLQPPGSIVALVQRDWMPVSKESIEFVAPASVLDAEFFAR